MWTTDTGRVEHTGRDAGATLASRAPLIAYLIAATLLLGLGVVYSSWDYHGQQPNKDIWQHVAALRALIADMGQASNPFVASDETSRHFHPMWVAVASIAHAADLSVWQALTVASILSMAILGAGIHAFARAYFASPWAPLVLLGTVMAGWIIQPAHTGFLSFQTILFAAYYPATTMVGLSLLLWALVIFALERSSPRFSLLLIPLVALLFATHQLGAVIGLIGAGCIVVFWPEGDIRRRVLVSVAVLAGLGLSLLWPFHNPLVLVLRPGNSTWEGGTDFFDLVVVSTLILPVLWGAMGLRDARGRAILAAILAYAAAYAIGFTGPQVAGRFIMPIAMCLQIGVAALILSWLDHPRIRAIPAAARAGVLCLATCAWLGAMLVSNAEREALERLPDPSLYSSAEILTADIPNTQEVVTTDLIAWPVVATGQRVHSIPWPEPGITDLPARQTASATLLDPTLRAEARLALATELGVRSIIVGRHPVDRPIHDALSREAARVVDHGLLIRFDLVAPE